MLEVFIFKFKRSAKKTLISFLTVGLFFFPACSNKNISVKPSSQYSSKVLAKEWKKKLKERNIPLDNDYDYYYPKMEYIPSGRVPYVVEPYHYDKRRIPDNDENFYYNSRYPKYNPDDDNSLRPYQPQEVPVLDNDVEYDYPLYFDAGG